MKDFINTLLTVPEANSRLVYLCQGVATALVIVCVGVAYVTAHDGGAREGYSTMMMALLGGGGLGSVCRGWAKNTSQTIGK